MSSKKNFPAEGHGDFTVESIFFSFPFSFCFFLFFSFFFFFFCCCFVLFFFFLVVLCFFFFFLIAARLSPSHYPFPPLPPLPPLSSDPPVSEWVAHTQLSDHKFADVVFSFDRKQVYAHSTVLCVRSQVLFEMYDKIASKKKKKQRSLVTLTIPQPYGPDYPITSDAFEMVLQFLYADNLQLESLGAREALDLCNAAKALELPRLARICRDRVHDALSLANVHGLLKAAHDTKEELARGYCIRYASTVKKDFIGNKDEIAKIGVDLFQDVMASLMVLDDDEGVKESTPIPQSTLMSDFRKLYSDTEMGVIHGDSLISFKGSEVSFHKSFFAARSKSLSQSFQPSLDGNENTTEILKVKDLLTTVDAFKAILKYLYYGDISGFFFFSFFFFSFFFFSFLSFPFLSFPFFFFFFS